MRRVGALIVFFLLVSCKTNQAVVYTEPKEWSTYTLVEEGVSDSAGTTFIYGHITEKYCEFGLAKTRVSYLFASSSSSWLYYANRTSIDADSLGNYQISLDSLSSYGSSGLSFYYRSANGYSEGKYFIPIPKSHEGKKIRLDVQIDTYPIWGGLDCF